jgi:hypothetical protein
MFAVNTGIQNETVESTCCMFKIIEYEWFLNIANEVAAFSPWGLGLKPGWLYESVVDKVALGQVFSWCHRFIPANHHSTIVLIYHRSLRCAMALSRQHSITTSVFRFGASPLRSMPRLRNEGQLPLRESPDTAEVWYGRQPARTWVRRQKNVHCWKPLPSNGNWRPWLRTLVCVW